MIGPLSLRTRLALGIGALVTVLWLGASALTAQWLRQDIDGIMDTGLRATAQRVLPLAIRDLQRRVQRRRDVEDDEHNEREHDETRVQHVREYDEDRFERPVLYLVRDRRGRVILRSEGAPDNLLPPEARDGFQSTGEHRIYVQTDRQSGATIAVAEPLNDRRAMSRNVLIGLAWPVVIVIPLSLLVIFFAVRRMFRPLLDLQHSLQQRSAQDLTVLPETGLPAELRPVVGGLNSLLTRLSAAFEAERSFAANAAHELRTPVAGAIAQAQRLRAETTDTQAAKRASDIETTLKRLNRTSEKLMQFARAEGGRAVREVGDDVRAVLKVVADDFAHSGENRVAVSVPSRPVLSTIEPDALGILCRNLVENGLRHGVADGIVALSLTEDGVLGIGNDGPILGSEAVERLMTRFEKGDGNGTGTGLGLSIVRTIVDRAGAHMTVTSPRPQSEGGVLIEVRLPR